MARRKPAGPIKSFTNLDEVFAKMEEFGFFVNEEDKLTRLDQLKNPGNGPWASNEFWFSNMRGAEIKIFRQIFGGYELCNFKGVVSDQLDELFELAEIPKIR